MKNIHLVFMLLLSTALGLSSCDKYDEYVTDYDYSAVYFGSQKPLRTVVTRENSSTLNFKMGVVLGGLLDNKSDNWASFEIDPSLFTKVDGASGFQLLPSDWYTFSITGNKVTIPRGKFLGDFTVSIDKAKFTSVPGALTNTYALPIRLTGTSVDSVLSAKNYTILVVKYISQWSGTYYVRGTESEYNPVSGEIIAGTSKVYSNPDWVKNKTRLAATLTPSDCNMEGMGYGSTSKMKVTFSAGTVKVATSEANPTVMVTDLGSSFDTKTGEYHLVYTYATSGKTYKVDETLKQRNDPENDLRFEEW